MKSCLLPIKLVSINDSLKAMNTTNLNIMNSAD